MNKLGQKSQLLAVVQAFKVAFTTPTDSTFFCRASKKCGNLCIFNHTLSLGLPWGGPFGLSQSSCLCCGIIYLSGNIRSLQVAVSVDWCVCRVLRVNVNDQTPAHWLSRVSCHFKTMQGKLQASLKHTFQLVTAWMSLQLVEVAVPPGVANGSSIPECVGFWCR